MHVSQEILDSSVQRFLNSTDGEEFLEGHSTPVWMGVILSGFLLAMGLFLCSTIIGAKSGFRYIWKGLRGEAFKLDSGGKLQRQRDDIRSFIGHVIIAGPPIGVKGERAALVLGAFQPVPHDTLAELSQFFSQVYLEQIDDPAHADLRDLLQDDIFQANRRRIVPKPYRKGLRLYFFDMRLDVEQTVTIEESSLTGVIAIPGPDGTALQLPWEVVASAVETGLSDLQEVPPAEPQSQA